MRIAVLLVWLTAVWHTPTAAQRSYVIQRFDATIQVERGGGIDVTETILARFNGSWNGIYRTIPVKYRTAQGLNWTLGLDLEGVTDGAGHPLRVETSRERHYMKFKIWVPGAANATRTVVLHYRATNGLRFFDEHDELYWNVTGDEWQVPIEAAAARIELPPGTDGVRAIAFNGAYGSTARDARIEIRGTTVRIAMRHALEPREGLTAVVGWNKGVVAEPTAAARVAETIGSNWPLVLPCVAFVAAFATWRRRGKDPRRRPIAVQYEPPRGLTPAEAGTLIDNSADLRDVTATLVDLAVRGYLRIEEREEAKFLGLIGGGRTYVLHQLDRAADAPALAPHEQRVLDGVFAGRGSSVPLDELESEFYGELPRIRNSVFDRLLDQGFYHARPDRVRTHWKVAALILGVLIAVGGAVSASLFLLTAVPFLLAGLLVTVILFAFGLIMPARTEAGTRALEQVLGFEEFLRRVEAENYQGVIAGHPELFDKYLPFAMAFGVEKRWARAFEGIYTEPPRWYVGPRVTDFSVSRFSLSLADLAGRAGATMTSGPRSSTSTSQGSASMPRISFGSGFSSGGGFSGGGGGGGGGGAF